MIFRRAILLVALIILTTSSAFCADMIMGRADAQQTSYTTEKLEPPLSMNWEYTANKFANNPSSPVVAGNTCFFTCGDRVYAVDATTGIMKWRYPSDLGLGGTVKVTPVVSDGKVYFGGGDGNLYCVDATTGLFQWAYQTRGAIRCTPVIEDGILFVGADDNSLYTINAETGEAAWPKPFVLRDDMASGIAVGSGMAVVACMDGNMYGVYSNTGKGPVWKFRLPLAPVCTSPIIVEREKIVVMIVGQMMYGLSVRSGQQRWVMTLPAEAAATPASDGSSIYIPCKNKKVYAYNITARAPSIKWTEPANIGANLLSSPTVADRIIYVTAAKGVIVALSAVDGSEKWRYAISPSMINTPNSLYTAAASSPTVAAGNLFVLTDDGVLHNFSQSAPDNVPPDMFGETPVNGTVMSGAPPIKMSAVIYDIGSGVDYSSATMSLDAQPVDHIVDPGTSTVSYETEIASEGKSVKPLRDGLHVISLSIKDYKGNLLVKEWVFTTDSGMLPPRRTKQEVEPGKKKKAPKTRPTKPLSPYAPPTPPSGYGGGMPPPPPPAPAAPGA